jgi:hypothetical protein
MLTALQTLPLCKSPARCNEMCYRVISLGLMT